MIVTEHIGVVDLCTSVLVFAIWVSCLHVNMLVLAYDAPLMMAAVCCWTDPVMHHEPQVTTDHLHTKHMFSSNSPCRCAATGITQ